MATQKLNLSWMFKVLMAKMIFALFIMNAASHAFDDKEWRFGGVSYGVTTWFKVINECKDESSTVKIKFENSKSYPVLFHYRMKNSYWVKTASKLLPANSTDSTYNYLSDEKTCRLKLDQLWGEAKVEEK